MKTKILFISLALLVAIFILNKINETLLKSEIKSVKYDYQLITDFVLIGKTDTDFYLKGDSILEKGNQLDIENFNLTYFKDGKPIYISSKKGIYFKNSKILKLIEDVNIKDERIKMLTEEMLIYTNKDQAKTNKDVTILSKKMKTTGNKAFIDMKKESIKVYKAKTIIK
jgi:LPS export ABC transporter protein LptC